MTALHGLRFPRYLLARRWDLWSLFRECNDCEHVDVRQGEWRKPDHLADVGWGYIPSPPCESSTVDMELDRHGRGHHRRRPALHQMDGRRFPRQSRSPVVGGYGQGVWIMGWHDVESLAGRCYRTSHRGVRRARLDRIGHGNPVHGA